MRIKSFTAGRTIDKVYFDAKIASPTDAAFNIGTTMGTVQSLPAGVYLAMNGRIFDPTRTRKNIEEHCFEEIR